jgi:hypothetical protein
MTLHFACGHVAVEVGDNAQTPPECPYCHETRVVRVVAPPPRFTGVGRGPFAEKTE